MFKSMIAAAFGGIALLVILVGGAAAETKGFNKPMQGPNRLDWCYDWGTGCGAQAATAWCKANGFSGGATAYHIANDIGASSPTRLISNGAVCDQGFCDGFADITCTRPDPTQTFNNPMQGGDRLDWCYSWGNGCGAPAATAWCKAQGFANGAVAYHIANDIGAAHPTRLISTGAVCDQDFCDGFTDITCKH